MSKKTKSHPHHSKPYSNKVAERAAVKRSMRTGGAGQAKQDEQMRSQQAGGTPNPREESRLIGGPDAERNVVS